MKAGNFVRSCVMSGVVLGGTALGLAQTEDKANSNSPPQADTATPDAPATRNQKPNSNTPADRPGTAAGDRAREATPATAADQNPAERTTTPEQDRAASPTRTAPRNPADAQTPTDTRDSFDRDPRQLNRDQGQLNGQFQGQAGANRARDPNMQWHNNQWWYAMPGGQWKYWNNSAWIDYTPGVFQPQGGAYFQSNGPQQGYATQQAYGSQQAYYGQNLNGNVFNGNVPCNANVYPRNGQPMQGGRASNSFGTPGGVYYENGANINGGFYNNAPANGVYGPDGQWRAGYGPVNGVQQGAGVGVGAQGPAGTGASVNGALNNNGINGAAGAANGATGAATIGNGATGSAGAVIGDGNAGGSAGVTVPDGTR